MSCLGAPSGASGSYRLDDVVLAAPELDIRSEHRPERPALPLVRQADAPGIDHAKPAREEAVVLHVGVAAHEHVGFDGADDSEQFLVGCRARVDRLVRAGRRVAHEDVSEALDVELERQRPGGDGREAFRTEPILVPRRLLVVDAPHLLEPVRVSVNDPGVDVLEAVEHLRGPRPAHAVAGDDDRVDVRLLDVGEHGVESRQVAVDVADRGDAHGVEATARVAGAARRRRGRARGSPSTRTRSAWA